MTGQNQNTPAAATQTVRAETETERKNMADTAAIEKSFSSVIKSSSNELAPSLLVSARSENSPSQVKEICLGTIAVDRAANKCTLGVPRDPNFRSAEDSIWNNVFAPHPTPSFAATRNFFQGYNDCGSAADKKTYVEKPDSYKYDGVDHKVFIINTIKEIATCYWTADVVFDSLDYVTTSVNKLPRHAWDAIYRSIIGASNVYQVKSKEDFLKSYTLAGFSNRRDTLHKAITESEGKQQGSNNNKQQSHGSNNGGRDRKNRNSKNFSSNNDSSHGRRNRNDHQSSGQPTPSNSANANNNSNSNNNGNANTPAAASPSASAAARPILFVSKGPHWIARMNKSYDASKTGKVCEACIHNNLNYVYSHNTDECSKCERVPPFKKH